MATPASTQLLIDQIVPDGNFTAQKMNPLLSYLNSYYNNSTSDPTTSNDSSEKYYAFKSLWYNSTTGNLFVCIDDTIDAAVWRNIDLFYSGANDPDIDDDVSGGYIKGSLGINTVTGVLFVCIDNTAGEAVWKKIVTDVTAGGYVSELTNVTPGADINVFDGQYTDVEKVVSGAFSCYVSPSGLLTQFNFSLPVEPFDDFGNAFELSVIAQHKKVAGSGSYSVVSGSTPGAKTGFVSVEGSIVEDYVLTIMFSYKV